MEKVKSLEVTEYRNLGKTGLMVSLLGFGTGPLGNAYNEVDAAEATRAIHLAISSGINFFDSSPYYGMTLSEARLGQALEGKRHEVVLATKCGRYGLHDFDFSEQRVSKSIDESLRRLKTDYLDLFQVHDVEFGDFSQIVNETLPAMRKIQESGKARFIGITGYPPKFLARIAAQVPVDTILSYCHYNLMNTDMDEVLTPFAKANGLGLINASALHMGILTPRGGPEWHPAPLPVREAAKRAAEICRNRGAELSKVAIRFCLDHPYASTTLVGMSTVEEVQENLKLFQMKSDPELIKEIRASLGSALDYVWPSGKPENHG
jgi:L-galactose dehydrogenase